MKNKIPTIADLWPSQTTRERATIKVFDEQLALMIMYKNEGRIPDWNDFDLAERENQKFVRGLISYLEEEMIEAQFEHETLWEEADSNQDTYPRLIKLNEEVADTLHFWVELFIYSDIQFEDLDEYYKNLSEEKAMNSTYGDVLSRAIQFASSYIKQMYSFNTPYYKLNPNSTTWVPFEVNGHTINQYRVEKVKIELFNCIKHLKLVQNTLKNKYWKSQDYPVDLQSYQHNLMEAWLHWTIAIALMDFTDYKGLIGTYLLKNDVNKIKVTKA